jgi:hypothetical protein
MSRVPSCTIVLAAHEALFSPDHGLSNAAHFLRQERQKLFRYRQIVGLQPGHMSFRSTAMRKHTLNSGLASLKRGVRMEHLPEDRDGFKVLSSKNIYSLARSRRGLIVACHGMNSPGYLESGEQTIRSSVHGLHQRGPF